MKSIPTFWEASRKALYDELGDPYTSDSIRLKKISPLFHADKVINPVMVLQGANDPRVLQIESDEIVEELIKNDIPVEYVIFEDEGHGFRKKENQIEGYRKIKSFLDLYLKTSKRKYIALVWGVVEKDEGTINENLARDPKNRLIMSVPEDKEIGKSAITHYKVLERFNYVTLLECQLETGRTHQIRAHMKFIGHPIFSDQRYGGDKILKGTIFNKYKQFVQNCFKTLPRQALHAKSLGFSHPVLKKELDFVSDLPEDFTECLNKWRNYSNNI